MASRLRSSFLAGLSTAIGGGSLLLLMLFLYRGPLTTVRLGWNDASALCLNAALCVTFFLQHSVMVRKPIRERVERFLHAGEYPAVYSIFSGLCLLLLLAFWQRTAPSLFEAEGWLRGLMRSAFFVSLVGFAWSAAAVGPIDTFGARSALRPPREAHPVRAELAVRGPYRWVRHPMYFLTLVLIWSYPDVTADRLLFNGLFTVWIVVASVLEERDLVTQFGQPYRDYQATVPMLLPYRLPQ
ncbi:MAG: isoprenylcysteine carboxylmethyltransferase family protein [Acidobacteriota bacterium]|nr:MAG: isoprenylcysteine carboxylmethyltransferase family protein [Acidobacteriota bacterium]